jgi:hypothetical protein
MSFAPNSTNAILHAAQGYLGLGMAQEAWDELERIAPKHKTAPVVLKVRLEAARALGQWELVAELARHLLSMEPDDPLHAAHLEHATRQLQPREKSPRSRQEIKSSK